MNKKIKIICVSITMIFFLITLIIYSKDTADTIRHCIKICMDTLIPSIFAYMILCTFLINSRFAEIIATPIWHLAKGFIKLDKKLFSVFLLSTIAGYPVGIKMLKEIITKKPAYNEMIKKIASFCFAGGPAFIIGIAGNVIYNSATAGLIIFISCTASNIMCLIFISRKEIVKSDTDEAKIDISGRVISTSLLSSAKAMLIVCLSMIVFNIVIEIMLCFAGNALNENDLFSYLKAIVEITNIYTLDAATPLWLTTFFVSFGGLCVIFQIYIIADGIIDFWKFVLSRLLPSSTSALICYTITEISGFDACLPVTSLKVPQLMLKNPIVLFSTGCMTLIFIMLLSDQIGFLKKYKKFSKKTRFIEKNML